jgi:mannan endo-1,6-alpha-mannosidase
LNGIIKGIDVFFKDDVMFEVACEQKGTCNTDQRSFKAYLSRWMGYTMIVAPFTRETLLKKLQTSAKAAAAQCNGAPDGNTCGLKWTGDVDNDPNFGVGEQMAALEVMQNLLIGDVPGPVTLEAGGISKSNPSAGSEPQSEPVAFDAVTTGDKAGAGFLTTVILIMILAGAWWMVS